MILELENFVLLGNFTVVILYERDQQSSKDKHSHYELFPKSPS